MHSASSSTHKYPFNLSYPWSSTIQPIGRNDAIHTSSEYPLSPQDACPNWQLTFSRPRRCKPVSSSITIRAETVRPSPAAHPFLQIREHPAHRNDHSRSPTHADPGFPNQTSAARMPYTNDLRLPQPHTISSPSPTDSFPRPAGCFRNPNTHSPGQQNTKHFTFFFITWITTNYSRIFHELLLLCT